MAQCRAYNDWLTDHVAESGGRLHGIAVLPQRDPEAAAAEIRRMAGRPGIVGVQVRPNPAVDWKPFNDEVYDPHLAGRVRRRAARSGFHPLMSADLPGAVQGLRLGQLGTSDIPVQDEADIAVDNIFFTQMIGNPVDMMNDARRSWSPAACSSRFPDLRVVFLEANGGWIVPWLERLDHHAEIYGWDVPWLKRGAVGHLPPPVLDQLRRRRVDPGLHRRVAAGRRRPHHVGHRLPPPRRQDPRHHRHAARRHRHRCPSTTSERSPAATPRLCTAWVEEPMGDRAGLVERWTKQLPSDFADAVPLSMRPPLTRFRDAGYVLERGLFSVAEASDILAEARSAGRREASRNELSAGGMEFASNIFHRSRGLQDVVRDPRIVIPLQAILGPGVWCRWDQAVCKKPGAGWFPWHQDNGYTGSRPSMCRCGSRSRP